MSPLMKREHNNKQIMIAIIGYYPIVLLVWQPAADRLA